MEPVKEEANAAISEEQTHTLRLVLFLNEQGSFALKERLVYEIFNHLIQNKKVELQSILSQPQFDELFSGQSCPQFGEISLDVKRIISATVFGLPTVPKGHDVLLKTHLEGEGLNTFLGGYSDHIRNKKVLSKKQLGCLFPVTHLNKLDITLLSFLLFEIFNIKPTSLCFAQLPQQHHIQIGDDILRLRFYRNEVSHIGVTGINQERFNTFWKDISGAIIRILGVEYKSRLDELKTKCIDSPMLLAYRKLIEQWHQEDLETRRYLEEIRQDFIDFRKCAGHRDYQQRIWWKSQLTENTKKLREYFLQSSKTLSETYQKGEVSERLKNALLFENREDMLRACHLLDMNRIPFKTHSGSSLVRSTSSVGPGSSHAKRNVDTQTKETRKKECTSKEHSTSQRCTSSKGRRRWTGPVLYKRDEIQTTKYSGIPTYVDLLCNVMHTPTSLLDEPPFLTNNLPIHTPTSSLDAADLDAMEECSVFSAVVDLPVSLHDVTRRRNGQSSRQHNRHSDTYEVNASTPRTESINRESDRYKREQRLERRKLRKMQKEDMDEKTQFVAQQSDLKSCYSSHPDTPVPFHYARGIEVSKGHTHPSSAPKHFQGLEESQDFKNRKQNKHKRWTTHPIRQAMRTNDSFKNRRKSASDAHPRTFISILKRIQNRYEEKDLDYSQLTDKPSKPLGFSRIDETSDECEDNLQDSTRQSLDHSKQQRNTKTSRK